MQLPFVPREGRLKTIPPERRLLRELFTGGATVPQVTTTVDVDMSQVMALRDAFRQELQKSVGIPLGFMPFFIQAAARAAHTVPETNACLVPDGLWLFDRVHMGVSVSTPWGVVIPVISDPEQKSLTQVAIDLHQKILRARSRSLQPEDMLPNATFGLSNPGSIGIRRDVPMVVPPQVAMLSCAAVVPRPWAVGKQVEVRPIMEVSLSLDHRAMDGLEAGEFLRTFRESLEEPHFEL